MTKNSSDKEQKSIWDLNIVTGPEHDLMVNGKEFKGLEETLAKLSVNNDLNWFEYAGILTYIAAGQIAAADHQAGAEDAFNVWLQAVMQMYATQRTALLNGSNEIANPAPGATIN